MRTIHTDVLTGRDVVTGLQLAYPVAWEERPIRSCPRCGQDVPADPGCPVILNTGAGQGGALEPVTQQHGCGEWLGVAYVEGYDGQDPAELAAKFRADLDGDLDGDEDNDEDNDEAPQYLRGKWLMDGATTLEEAAQKLEDEARDLRRLHHMGWVLAEPIANDYGELVRPDPGLPLVELRDGRPRLTQAGHAAVDDGQFDKIAAQARELVEGDPF